MPDNLRPNRQPWQAIALITTAFVALAIAFTWIFGSSFPITDDWFFVRNSLQIATGGFHVADLHWRIYNHPAILPELVYAAMAPLVHYDSRAFVILSIACLCGIALLIQRRLALTPLEYAAVDAVFLGGAHYLDFVWAMQFTNMLLMLGVTIALIEVDRQRDWRGVVRGVAWTSIALLCGAGASFGFLAAAVLIAAGYPKGRGKWLQVALNVALFATVASFLRDPRPLGSPAVLAPGKILTAIGGIVVGFRGGERESLLGAAMFIGLVLLSIAGTVIVLAWRHRKIERIALPLAFLAYSGSSLAAIVVSRPNLGNWHLIFAGHAITGAIGAATMLHREVGSTLTLWLRRAALVCCGLALFGWWNAYVVFGPEHATYAGRIEKYALTLVDNPEPTAPYPATGDGVYSWNLTPKIALFLAAEGHPLFSAENEAWLRQDQGVAIRSPVVHVIDGREPPAGKLVFAMVEVPASDQRFAAAVAQYPSGRAILRRFHTAKGVFYAGFIRSENASTINTPLNGVALQ